MALKLQYGQVEAILAALYGIADDKRVAFQGRIKHLQRQGFPPGTNTGKGKAASYSFPQLMQMVIALELIQAGLMPQLAGRLTAGSWGDLAMSVYSCTFSELEAAEHSSKPTEYLWLLSVEALRSLTGAPDGEFDGMEEITAVPIEDAPKFLALRGEVRGIGQSWRTLVLNGYQLTQKIMYLVAFWFKYATREEMRADLLGEIEGRNASVRELAETLSQLPPPTPEQREYIKNILGNAGADILRDKAIELVPYLTPQAHRFLYMSKGPKAQFVLDAENKPVVLELIDLGVFEVVAIETPAGPVLDGLQITPFGGAVIKVVGGKWAQEIEENDGADEDKAANERRDQAIAEMSADALDAIARDDTILLYEEGPIHSELIERGIIEMEDAPFPFKRSARWTELGRSISFELNLGARPARRYGKIEVSHGDDQKA